MRLRALFLLRASFSCPVHQANDHALAAPGPINGELEGKYTDKAHGLTLTQAWTTSNVLRTQVRSHVVSIFAC